MDGAAWPWPAYERSPQHAAGATRSSASQVLAKRYTPAADGLPLPAGAWPPAVTALQGFEHFWPNKRNALALGIEPYAMLVHKAKARQARVGHFSLAGLAARGLRPGLPINLNPESASFGDSGWIHPLFAEYTGWPSRGAPALADLFLDPGALDGMTRLRETLLACCDAAPADSSDQVLSALLDAARPRTLAVYGNPLMLAARLCSQGRSEAEAKAEFEATFEVVSLQQFMGLSAPSLFRTVALQVHSAGDADQVFASLRLLSEPLAPGQPPLPPSTLPHQALRPEAPMLAALPHDFAFYARLPQLHCLADTSLMATLALNLARPRAEGSAAADSASRVYMAAAAAHYEMARHAHRERGARPGISSALAVLNPV